ncbi:MAG: MBL fold metallo-hydrolase [Bacillota bacterium]
MAAAIEQVFEDLYRVEVPLPRNPLKATNSYIIKAKPRNLVIDTGMNREECKSVLIEAFDQLKIDPQDTDFFITHLHADHVGLAGVLSADQSKVFFNRPDAEVLNMKNLWQVVCQLAGVHGFPQELVEQAIDSHPGQRYSPVGSVDFTMVEDGEQLHYGFYRLHCVVTPGHTGGHTCLYEPGRKLFFSGDHILGDITPNISTWVDDRDPLGEYFASLDKVYEMPVELALPGHRSLIRDCRQRIEELKEHHRQRLEEVLEIIGAEKPKSAYQVAAEMSWDLVAECWEDFPLMQKWFATGEALAHIRHLEFLGKVKRGGDDNKQVYTIN